MTEEAWDELNDIEVRMLRWMERYEKDLSTYDWMRANNMCEQMVHSMRGLRYRRENQC